MGSGLHHCPRGNRMSGSTTPRPPIGLHDRASPMLASPQPALHRYGLMLLDPIVPCWTRAPQLHIPSSSSPGADAWGVAVLAAILGFLYAKLFHPDKNPTKLNMVWKFQIVYK
ncbi:hypothetical protein TRIUR3_11507 [Triticum urartu]|uniref:Uncharacterized protein n=1 Tax=Triticum urartu TaxID=4572 RepID=M7ZPC0_TRIUA|nr:hypothetical protein TRIUR3_11507 [Triticum urartu]